MHTLAVMDDGQMASVSYDTCEIRIWDMATAATSAVHEKKKQITCVLALEGSRLAGTVSPPGSKEQNMVRIWEGATGACVTGCRFWSQNISTSILKSPRAEIPKYD